MQAPAVPLQLQNINPSSKALRVLWFRKAKAHGLDHHINMHETLTTMVFFCSLLPLHADLCPTVPIYDGRVKSGKPFTFTTQDFRDLTSWPLYKKGGRDLPEDAVVAVGYTMNTYNSERTGAMVLSTNVQFVILLAVPVSKV